MTETTKEQLVSAASRLLDAGGQEAVTLRSVAEQVGVSHNAPYRHFSGRSGLLAAVAERDFTMLRSAFEHENSRSQEAEAALHAASVVLIAYGQAHKARYRLLFSDPQLVADANLKAAAFGSFTAFSAIVARCQAEGVLPGSDPVPTTGLIYATLHGAIDLEIGARASGAKGLGSVDATARMLFKHLKSSASSRTHPV